MPEQKTTKVITRRRKFISVEIPITKTTIELIGNSLEDIKNRTIKLDLTRQLKGKSVEAIVRIKIENNHAIAYPEKIKLMTFFIRRMIRKRISYVEDSFITPSQENMIVVKPFLITRKRVSRRIRKTLRNKAKNWLEDYIKERKNIEIFNDILTNRLQKSLSLMLKKTYPLSLCEIRVMEIGRILKPEEVPKIEKKKETEKSKEKIIEQGLDQLKEIEDEKIKQAEKEIKETQKKALKLEKTDEETEKEVEKPKKEKKPRKTSKKSVNVSDKEKQNEKKSE